MKRYGDTLGVLGVMSDLLELERPFDSESTRMLL